MMRTRDREGASMTFLSDVVLISADEVAMKARSLWMDVLATIEASVGQDRAAEYQFDPTRARTRPFQLS
jgi:hypothetical protein